MRFQGSVGFIVLCLLVFIVLIQHPVLAQDIVIEGGIASVGIGFSFEPQSPSIRFEAQKPSAVSLFSKLKLDFTIADFVDDGTFKVDFSQDAATTTFAFALELEITLSDIFEMTIEVESEAIFATVSGLLESQFSSIAVGFELDLDPLETAWETKLDVKTDTADPVKDQYILELMLNLQAGSGNFDLELEYENTNKFFPNKIEDNEFRFVWSSEASADFDSFEIKGEYQLEIEYETQTPSLKVIPETNYEWNLQASFEETVAGFDIAVLFSMGQMGEAQTPPRGMTSSTTTTIDLTASKTINDSLDLELMLSDVITTSDVTAKNNNLLTLGIGIGLTLGIVELEASVEHFAKSFPNDPVSNEKGLRSTLSASLELSDNFTLTLTPTEFSRTSFPNDPSKSDEIMLNNMIDLDAKFESDNAEASANITLSNTTFPNDPDKNSLDLSFSGGTTYQFAPNASLSISVTHNSNAQASNTNLDLILDVEF